ncbi:MAG TPA: HPF/RaiA family ribosome-associated protein [Azospirillaceae bacterium]|nr:HPF/RaiA family ribosome-associated protein [Azospirillaceae bacterium]
MQSPLEIAFHNMDSNPGAETMIRERFEKLERLYDGLVGARVSVEAQHKQHRTGNVFDVHIVLMVPGHNNLVVSREPKKAKEKYAHPDLHTSIRDAFEAAERQLIEFKRQLRGEVKRHDFEVMGQIAQLADDHGFLMTNTGGMLYFHRNSVINPRFEDLSRGDSVLYVEEMGDTGPTASKVWKDAGERLQG